MKRASSKRKKEVVLRSTSGKDVQPFIRISTSWNDNLNTPRLISAERSEQLESFLQKIGDKVVQQKEQEQGPIEIEHPDLSNNEKITLATEYINVLRPITKRPAAGIS
jgi:hypothetical protein